MESEGKSWRQRTAQSFGPISFRAKKESFCVCVRRMVRMRRQRKSCGKGHRDGLLGQVCELLGWDGEQDESECVFDGIVSRDVSTSATLRTSSLSPLLFPSSSLPFPLHLHTCALTLSLSLPFLHRAPSLLTMSSLSPPLCLPPHHDSFPPLPPCSLPPPPPHVISVSPSLSPCLFCLFPSLRAPSNVFQSSL